MRPASSQHKGSSLGAYCLLGDLPWRGGLATQRQQPWNSLRPGRLHRRTSNCVPRVSISSLKVQTSCRGQGRPGIQGATGQLSDTRFPRLGLVAVATLVFTTRGTGWGKGLVVVLPVFVDVVGVEAGQRLGFKGFPS